MRKEVTEGALTSEWQPRGQQVAKGQNYALAFDSQVRKKEVQIKRECVVNGLYSLREKAFALAGGADAVCEALDEKPSYLSTISKCINRSAAERMYPIDWDSALLLQPEAATELIHGYAALAEMEALVRPVKEEVDRNELKEAALEVLKELATTTKAEEMLNRKLGKRPGTVKL
jgi:hypothetical protein